MYLLITVLLTYLTTTMTLKTARKRPKTAYHVSHVNLLSCITMSAEHRHRADAANPNKTAPFLRARGDVDGRLSRHIQSPIQYTYVDSRAAQRLETPPRTSTSLLASDTRSRPSSAQPCTDLIIIIIIINRHFKDAQLTKVATKAPAVTTIQDDKQSTS